MDNQIEAWNLPQGVISHLFRDIAAGKPGTLTAVGLDTFVDPRHGGGKLNARTTEELVRLMPIDGQDYLFYKAFPIHGASSGPPRPTPMAISPWSAKPSRSKPGHCHGRAQFGWGGHCAGRARIAERGSLNPRQVKVPGVLVDAVVLATEPAHHQQTFAEPLQPAFSGELRVPMDGLQPMPLSERKIIARRAAQELRPHQVVNLGIGMPRAWPAWRPRRASLTWSRSRPSRASLAASRPGLNFGAAVNPQAIIDQPSQFDFYDGGAGHRDPGPGPGGPAWQPECEQIRTAPGRSRWLHQHQPERQDSWSCGHLHGRSAAGAGRLMDNCASRTKGARASSCVPSNIAPSAAPKRSNVASGSCI